MPFALALPIEEKRTNKTHKDAVHQDVAHTSSPPKTQSYTTSSRMTPKQESTYYLVPNHLGLDPSAREADFNSHSWVQPIVIEDEDLMFGGKSLSAWYEEDRRRLSSGSDDGRTEHSQEEERRGRERVRRHHKSSKSHRK